jgi:hypothetical protein
MSKTVTEVAVAAFKSLTRTLPILILVAQEIDLREMSTSESN